MFGFISGGDLENRMACFFSLRQRPDVGPPQSIGGNARRAFLLPISTSGLGCGVRYAR
jgi:hypothetical protein